MNRNVRTAALLVVVHAALGCATTPMELRSRPRGSRTIKTEHYSFMITGVDMTKDHRGLVTIWIQGNWFWIEPTDVERVAAHFEVTSPEKLAGERIASLMPDPGQALTNLVFYLRTGIDWVPDNPKEMNQFIAVSLAAKQCPRFQEADSGFVDEYFSDVLADQESWVSWLAGEVERRSGGAVKVARKKREAYHDEDSVMRLALVVGEQTAPFVVSNSQDIEPITCGWSY